MDNLNKTQKIIVIAICICMLTVIGYYIMQKTKTSNTFNINSALENDNIGVESLDELKKSQMIIHITGEINNPGIIYLEEGERIKDAIDKAGGTTKEADLSKVNLAYSLQDGQKIYIPNINEKVNTVITEENGENVIVDNGELKSKLININKATQSELETLAGIGPSTALKIIEYRKQNGKFKKIEDIMNVPGIGESKFETMKKDITVK